MADTVLVSIRGQGHTLFGTQIGEKGGFASANGDTYRGHAKDGIAEGLGVFAWPNGITWSGGWSAEGRHGPFVIHWASGTVYYYMCDHDRVVHCAYEFVNGSCRYDHEACSADDARLLALKATALDTAVQRSSAPRPW